MERKKIVTRNSKQSRSSAANSWKNRKKMLHQQKGRNEERDRKWEKERGGRGKIARDWVKRRDVEKMHWYLTLFIYDTRTDTKQCVSGYGIRAARLLTFFFVVLYFLLHLFSHFYFHCFSLSNHLSSFFHIIMNLMHFSQDRMGYCMLRASTTVEKFDFNSKGWNKIEKLKRSKRVVRAGGRNVQQRKLVTFSIKTEKDISLWSIHASS